MHKRRPSAGSRSNRAPRSSARTSLIYPSTSVSPSVSREGGRESGLWWRRTDEGNRARQIMLPEWTGRRTYVGAVRRLRRLRTDGRSVTRMHDVRHDATRRVSCEPFYQSPRVARYATPRHAVYAGSRQASDAPRGFQPARTASIAVAAASKSRVRSSVRRRKTN